MATRSTKLRWAAGQWVENYFPTGAEVLPRTVSLIRDG
jgi:hypothetical protein